METTKAQCETFFNYLKETYRLNRKGVVVTLHCHPVTTIYREKYDLYVDAHTTCVRDKVEIHVANHNGIVEVFKTIAHEYKHCLQRYNELTWIGTGLSPIDSPLEDEANAFAEVAFKEFIQRYAKPAAPVVSVG